MKFTLALKKLPFEPDRKQVIYVESRFDAVVNTFIQNNYDRICTYCDANGYEFCYLPKLTEEAVTDEVLYYNAPYAKPDAEVNPLASDFLLQFMEHPENRELIPPSLLYLPKDGRVKSAGNVVTFNAMSVTDQEEFPTLEDIFFWRLNEIFESSRKHTEIRFSVEESSDDVPRFQKKPDISWMDKPMAIPSVKGILRVGEPETDDTYGSRSVRRESVADIFFDEESKLLAEEVKERVKRLEKHGIDRLKLVRYILASEPLSRLLITKEYRIFLPDYDNCEIVMTPLPKAVFLLFLRHPEGIPFKCLSDYKVELTEIYNRLKSLNGTNVSELSIEKVTNPLNNSINEKCARIREAFVAHFSEHLACNYFITGKRSEPKKITLPRELVIWEK